VSSETVNNFVTSTVLAINNKALIKGIILHFLNVSNSSNPRFFLQEAAKILKIKGLWESGLDQAAHEESEEEENEIIPQVDVNVAAKPPAVGKNPPVSPSMPELKSPPSIAQLKSMMQVVGSKRRKRSRNGTGSVEEVQEGAKQTKVNYLTN